MPDKTPARMAQAARQWQPALAEALSQFGDQPVAQAMRYATRGGKGLRGFLVMESAALHGVPPQAAVWAAAAIEALHAYSLIHDDLPCMDDDDLRRGQPTVHRNWDEATAVLAGDALQTAAFEMLCNPELGPAETRMRLISTLARAAGMAGMVRGQALDIMAESAASPLTLDQITDLQAAKTGALITWSAVAGARLAGADEVPMTVYGDALGLAFQIADDILDLEGDSATVGKAVGKDAAAGKATFVSLLGPAVAKASAAALADAACAALDGHGARANSLQDAARFVIARDR